MQQQSSFNQFFQNQKIQQFGSQKEEYEFPPYHLTQQKYTNCSQFVQKIIEWQQSMPPSFKKLWKYRNRRPYFYLACRYCNASIHLKQQEESIKFLAFNNIHVHNTKKYKQMEQQKVINYINFNQSRSICELKLLVMDKFKISSNRLSYIISKSNKKRKFQQIISHLDQKKYVSKYQFNHQTQFPELFLTFSPQMKQMAGKWGQVICIDITYNLIRQRPLYSGSQWGLAVFSGLDSNLRITIFAISLVSNQNHMAMKKIIQGYLSMTPKLPRIIISDEQASIKSAIQQLKSQEIFQGEHLFDIYHILKNIKKNIGKQGLTYFKRLIKCTSLQKFELILQKILESGIDQTFVQRFLQRQSLYCFVHLPNLFLGFSASNSRSQKINDLIKSMIPRETTFFNFFNKIHRLALRLKENTCKIERQTKKFQDLFNDIGIKQVRLLLQKKVFERFLQCYVRALKLNIEQIDLHTYLCTTVFKKQNYLIDLRDKSCRCGYYQKTGIICQHLLRTLWNIRQFNYINYINQRWIKQELTDKKLRTPKGRPKNSRKNLIR